jgi:protein farnesyltransferase subunit beta
LDLNALTRWLSARQKAPDAGFAGRTNKLVDGCYSHWVGGCWSFISAALNGASATKLPAEDLWSRDALSRYLLCCAQVPRDENEKPNSRKGGFRDKPGKNVDGYHTNYGLAGLGAAQFIADYNSAVMNNTQFPLAAPYGWKIVAPAKGPWDEADLISAPHPVFVVPVDKALSCRMHFEENSALVKETPAIVS